MLAAGTKAPDFARDQAVTDQPLVLIFFKVGCPTCQFTMPFVQRIADEAAGKATFLAVSQDDDAATREFFEEYKLKLPFLLDSSKQQYPGSNAYQIDYVPSFFVIAPDRVITQSFTGFVKGELETLAAGFGVEAFRSGEKVPALRPG